MEAHDATVHISARSLPVGTCGRIMLRLSPAADTRHCQLPSATENPLAGRICEKQAPGIRSKKCGHGGAACPRSRRGYGDANVDIKTHSLRCSYGCLVPRRCPRLMWTCYVSVSRALYRVVHGTLKDPSPGALLPVQHEYRHYPTRSCQSPET
jgi:hypothetical protein